MNFTEGMRRVGLGIAICCAVATLPAVIEMHANGVANLARYEQFQELVKTPAIKLLAEDAIRNKMPWSEVQDPSDPRWNLVKEIYIHPDGTVASIETRSGTLLGDSMLRPPWWSDLSLLLLPLLAFAGSWFFIRAFTWIVSGFLPDHSGK